MRRSCLTGPVFRAACTALAASVIGACAGGGEAVAPQGTGGAAAGASGAGGFTGGNGGTVTAGAAGSAGTGDPGGATGTAGTLGTGGTAGVIGAAGRGGTTGQGGIGGNGGAAGASGIAGRGGTTGGGGARGGAGGRAGTGGATTGSGGAGGTTGSAGAGGTPPPLKKYVGNIDTRGQARSDLATYWDQITPENAGKWGSVEGTRDRMNWSGLDAIHDYAKQHNIPFKQHNFIWGSQQPGWIGGLSQADQRAQVEEWIRLFCERYPDTQLIDVVNEPPPHTTPSYTAALGGAGSSGYDWIAQAFKWAHQYCPNAILILNDYNNIEYANDNNHTIDIVNRIKAAGAPITGVGAQAHACANLSASTIQANIDKIASQTGLPVYISEYDLNIADDNQQKNVMQSQFTMFWNDANVKGITIWGYIVGSTWETNSGLMTSSGTKRPAMTWLMDFLGR
jgi:endo-1,4-beta-xylanase